MEKDRKKRWIFILIGGAVVVAIILLLLLRSCDCNSNKSKNPDDGSASVVSEGSDIASDEERFSSENLTSGDDADPTTTEPEADPDDTESAGTKSPEDKSFDKSSSSGNTSSDASTTTASEKEKDPEGTTKGSEKTADNTTSSSKESETQGQTKKEEQTTAPTTAAPTTEAPTTQAPTTAAPTEPTSAAHVHNWVAVKKTVHHDQVTRTEHHDAVTRVEHHPEEGHYETVSVLVSPAWDEEITEVHTVCKGCGFDFTANHYNEEQLDAHQEQHMDNGEPSGWKTALVVVGTIHHDAVTSEEQQWVVDKAAWDETVVVTPEYDETIVVSEAYDEEIVTGYHCSGCGATKK